MIQCTFKNPVPVPRTRTLCVHSIYASHDSLAMGSQILRAQAWWVVFVCRIDVMGSDEPAVWMKKANFKMFTRIAVALMPSRIPVYEGPNLHYQNRYGDLPDNRPCNIPPLQAQHGVVHVDSPFSQYTPVLLCITIVNIIPYDDSQRHRAVGVQRLCGVEKVLGMSQLKSVEFEYPT